MRLLFIVVLTVAMLSTIGAETLAPGMPTSSSTSAAFGLNIATIIGAVMLLAFMGKWCFSKVENLKIAGAILILGTALAGSGVFTGMKVNFIKGEFELAMGEMRRLEGMIQTQGGNLTEAKLAYQDSLRYNPEDFRSQFALGSIALSEEDFDTANGYFTKLNAEFPKEPAVSIHLAKAQAGQEQFEQARSTLAAVTPATKDDKMMLLQAKHTISVREQASTFSKLPSPEQEKVLATALKDIESPTEEKRQQASAVVAGASEYYLASKQDERLNDLIHDLRKAEPQETSAGEESNPASIIHNIEIKLDSDKRKVLTPDQVRTHLRVIDSPALQPNLNREMRAK